jgi:hypothetical protein
LTSEAGEFCFTATQDALFARGWPHMHQLTDGKGGVAAAEKALAAGDPIFDVDVPRDTARPFLRAMMHPRQRAEARKEALSDPRPIDDEVLTKIVERLAPGFISEIHQFRVRDAAFLLEAFLGSERVATALVARLALCATRRDLWEQQLDNMNYHAFALADALAYMKLRIAPERWREIIAPLSTIDRRLFLAKRLALIADETLEWQEQNEFHAGTVLEVALQRGDRATLKKLWDAGRIHPWRTPRLYYVCGVELLDGADMKSLLRMPPWHAKQVVAQLGTIRAPAIVRVMMWLLSARAGKAAAAGWLRQHADFARPVLEAIAATSDEGPLAAAALEVVGGKRVEAPRALAWAEVSAQVTEMLDGLEARLMAAKGRAAERAVMEDAYTRYCEIRAAGGEESPEFYFTHHLADVKWESEEDRVERWMDLAVEVAS